MTGETKAASSNSNGAGGGVRGRGGGARGSTTPNGGGGGRNSVAYGNNNGGSGPASNKKSRTCRNVIIHGFCKFENQGCEYNHDPPASNATPSSSGSTAAGSALVAPGTPINSLSNRTLSTSSSSPEMKARFRVDSPVFTPDSSLNNAATSFNKRSPAAVRLESFEQVPSSVMHVNPQEQQPFHFFQPQQIPQPPTMHHDPSLPYHHYGTPSDGTYNHDPNYLVATPSGAESFYYPNSPAAQGRLSMAPQQPLQYHLYTSPLPHVSNLHPNQKSIHAFFMSDKIREELQRRSEACLQRVDPSTPETARFPQELHSYHSFFPLEPPGGAGGDKTTKIFGYPSSTFKCLSAVDGKYYVMRRIEGFRMMNELAIKCIEGWRRIKHAGIVSVREAFTTKAFADHSLVFVYDYHPNSTTLQAFYLSGTQNPPVPEKTLWSYITQIASAVKTIHAAGLAARILQPSKILVTGKNRVRLNCCGILDMIAFDGGKGTPQFQQEDLVHFGHLIVMLACGSANAIMALPRSLEYLSRNYSIDLKNLIIYLLRPVGFKSIDEVLAMIGPRLLHEINSAHHHNDYLENELSRELENGRVIRLLCKLGFINERPEFDMDPSWSETGDRYLLKLFRDYVFHQVDETGRALVDMGHVLQCLNKLDAGIDERLMLTSRDGQSCLIVTYRELRQCVQSSFNDLSYSKF